MQRLVNALNPIMMIDIFLEGIKSWISLCIVSLRTHSIYFIFIGLYLVALLLVDSILPPEAHHDTFMNGFISGTVRYFLIAIFLIITVRPFYAIIAAKFPDNPIRFLVKDFKNVLLVKSINIIPMIIVLTVFFHCFSAFKASVVFLNPFSWDQYWMELDRALHFGIDPWRLLQPLVGTPEITMFLSKMYSLWYFVMAITLVSMTFLSQDSKIRMQFFLALMFSWSIGGSLMAIQFSSAGPAFYHHLGLGMNPYADLLTYLHSVHEVTALSAIDIQAMLWENYQNNNILAEISITAMPSMHNAMAVLFALLGWHFNRVLGIIGIIYAILIFVGSVHLGWHYAVDGYVALIVTLICWWGAGKVTNWYLGQPSVQKDINKIID